MGVGYSDSAWFSALVEPLCQAQKGSSEPLGSVLSVFVAILAGTSLTLIVLSWCGSWFVKQRCLRLAKVFQRELLRRGLLTQDILRT